MRQGKPEYRQQAHVLLNPATQWITHDRARDGFAAATAMLLIGLQLCTARVAEHWTS